MKKILCFGMSNNLGGIENFIINYYRKLNKKEFQMDFVKTQNNICFEEEIISNGSQIYKITSRSKNPLKYCIELYQLLKKHKEYDIVHVNLNTLSSIEACIFGKMLGKKVIAHSHNVWKGKGKITKILIKINSLIIQKCTDIRLACSTAAGKYMFKKNKFEVIKNAIDASKFAYEPQIRKKVRNELDINGEHVIGIVGRIENQKNHLFLLKVFKKLLEKEKELKLLIVGDGKLKSNLIRYAEENQFLDKIIFTGARKDVNRLLQAMDIFALPSIYEGLGIVLIEAQASGLECIVSEFIQPEVYITDLVKNATISDENAWINLIIESLNGERNRKSQEEEIKKAGYDINTEIVRLENIYRSL